MIAGILLSLSSLLAPEACLEWDPIDSAAWPEVDGVHVWYSVDGGPVQPTVNLWHQPGLDPGVEQYWPNAFSPVRELPISIPVGAEICVTAQTFRVGCCAGTISNMVCFNWPVVCEFSTRAELLDCLGAKQGGVSWDIGSFGS